MNKIGNKGQALVEFTISFVVLVVFLVGIIDVGRSLYTQMNMNLLAQESARLGSLGESDSEILSYIEDNFQLGEYDQMTITITPDDSSRQSGDLLNIEIGYEMTFLMPGVGIVLPESIMTEAIIRVE